jgi:hypothetical protein
MATANISSVSREAVVYFAGLRFTSTFSFISDVRKQALQKLILHRDI